MHLYLTTTGRVTNQPREIEIWFTEHGGHFFLERESANRCATSSRSRRLRSGSTLNQRHRAPCTNAAGSPARGLSSPRKRHLIGPPIRIRGRLTVSTARVPEVALYGGGQKVAVGTKVDAPKRLFLNQLRT
jgi:hypothetical protein